MDKFIDYDKIIDHIVNQDDNTIEVCCYCNGTNKICPNPKNEKLCEKLYNWYLSTHAIVLNKFYIKPETLNEDIWKFN